MDLRQLLTLCRDAELGSFTKTAAALNVTQAAVSQQIKALEQELGSSEAVVSAVMQGPGIGVVSDRAAARELSTGNLKSVPVEGMCMERTFFLVTRRGQPLSIAAEALAGFLRAETDSA